MAIRLLAARRYLLDMRTRMPFRYGIATLTDVPHLFLRAEVEVDGRTFHSIAADFLAMKWFTKDPDTTYGQDIGQMLKVIETACDVARATPAARTAFDFCRQVEAAQSAWSGGWGIAPLLGHFGSSLIERVVLDAACQAWGIPFGQALRENRLGVRLGALHPELDGAEPRDLLVPAPLRSVIARHTVGLSDPLTDADIAPADRLDDGLPQSLESAIEAYGLTHFKVKLSGDALHDLARVRGVADVIERQSRRQGRPYALTLDGNENFHEVEAFRAFWAALSAEADLKAFLGRLIFVEQPLHRSVAMGPGAGELLRWADRPPIIIDESDGEPLSGRRALDLGYAGMSHKNCKGIIKSIANAALVEHRRRADPRARLLQSGEDLSNIGPIAQNQDLCVAANLGITHVERNAHHYFRGLAMFSSDVQSAQLRAHPDLYRHHERGFVTPIIRDGQMAIGSIVDHGLGVIARPDVERFTPAERWEWKGG